MSAPIAPGLDMALSDAYRQVTKGSPKGEHVLELRRRYKALWHIYDKNADRVCALRKLAA
ncbi:MAG: hypothetical protein GY750_17025 [Lentisphaerae bacterium]|nr:hypothetical protein [Lentisphaerota bacterium]